MRWGKITARNLIHKQMRIMETNIKITGSNGIFIAQIYVSGEWFKEVSVLGDIPDLLNAVTDALRNDNGFDISPKT